VKNNLEFYQHHVNAHNHWKFKALRREYARTFKNYSDPDGWAGEGKFWALNNLIASEEGAMLDTSNEVLMLEISSDLCFSIEEFSAFIDILVNRCKLVRKFDHFLTTKRVQTIFTEVQGYREKERERKKRGPKLLPGNQEIPSGNQEIPPGKDQITPRSYIQSKVKESKVKEIVPDNTPDGGIGPIDKNDVVGIVKNSQNGVEHLLKKGARKPAPKKRKESTPDTELFNSIKNNWMVWYKNRVGQPPRFGPKEAGSVSNVRKGLLGICRAGSLDPYQEAAAKFNFILDNWELLKKNNFLYTCVDITMINSKINEIFNAINSERIKKGHGGFVYDKL